MTVGICASPQSTHGRARYAPGRKRARRRASADARARPRAAQPRTRRTGLVGPDARHHDDDGGRVREDDGIRAVFGGGATADRRHAGPAPGARRRRGDVRHLMMKPTNPLTPQSMSGFVRRRKMPQRFGAAAPPVYGLIRACRVPRRLGNEDVPARLQYVNKSLVARTRAHVLTAGGHA